MNVFTRKLIVDTVVPSVGIWSNICASNLGIKIAPTASNPARACRTKIITARFTAETIDNNKELLPADALRHCQCH